jgi:hypothetical protein
VTLPARASISRRDEQLLRAVGELRLVSGAQLQRLAFAGPTATSTSDRVARRSLQRLTDHDFLQRLGRRVGGLRAGSSAWIYALTPRGARVVGRDLGRGRRSRPSLAFLQHHLGVAETFVQLHEAAQRGELELVQLATEPTCWRSIGDGSDSVLRPDLFVIVATGEQERLAFVEVDNGTEHVGALQRKLGLYRDYYASGQEQAREGVFPEVLWLALDQARRGRLQELFARRDVDHQLHRSLLQGELINYLTKGGES